MATVTGAASEAASGVEGRTISSDRSDSRTPMLALGGVALLIAMASLAGTRRRQRVPVRIKK